MRHCVRRLVIHPVAARRRRSLPAAGCLLALCLSLTSGCARTRPAVALPSPIDPLQQLRAAITAAIEMPGVQRGTWGIAVHSLTRDERLFELNARTLLVPASTSKLVSVATAAEAVGWDYRFETALRGTGPISEGTLHGDLIVVGSGDPSIGGRAGDDLTPFVEGLKALGVRRIDGRVIGDDDAMEDPRPQLAWAWDDLGYATGAIFGALNLAENRMQVTVSPASREGGPTVLAVDPQAAYRPLANRAVTGAASSTPLVWPEQRPGETFLTIAGSIPAGAMPARLTVSTGNPTFWFASVLRSRLLRDGIEVTGEAFDVDDVMPAPDRATATLLYTHRSHPLAEIVQPLLKESINLYGEAVLRLNVPPGRFPTNDAALEGMRARLASWGIPDDGQQLVDGSGLSRRNVISPDTLVTVLRRMSSAGTTSPFVTALPIAATDGSLAGRMAGTAAQGNVRAKTGTMSNVRSLAGYVATRDGELLAFAVIVNNFEGSGAAALKAIDAIAIRLAEFARQNN
jgi:serine-type D-Ala-D-Ala carboxypeptidase/endopeptidase (penicillin-binding protein 4)